MLIVKIKDYYPNANYPKYLNKGCEVSKPMNTTIEVGVLMYDAVNNSIGIVLGCIDETNFNELRLDSDGMRPIDSLRFANKDDFNIKDVKFKTDLDKLGITEK